jgi:hypothetical protein
MPMPTNQLQQPQGVQNAGNQGLAAQQGQQRFTGGQGFSSWGQGQGLRFPGQGSVVGDSRTIFAHLEVVVVDW